MVRTQAQRGLMEAARDEILSWFLASQRISFFEDFGLCGVQEPAGRKAGCSDD